MDYPAVEAHKERTRLMSDILNNGNIESLAKKYILDSGVDYSQVYIHTTRRVYLKEHLRLYLWSIDLSELRKIKLELS
ncbi:MAG: hypothetical protein DRG78_00430 [Epsilonproteobacteria bacterium]|nr:MAG: hypothetical protein DRG78_00430 [Campylobacterota bacterium]